MFNECLEIGWNTAEYLHHQMKHREESWKYDAQRSIFDELRGDLARFGTPPQFTLAIFQDARAFPPWQVMLWNRPFYSYGWKRGWGWACFGTNLPALMFDISSQTKKVIFEGEIKDANTKQCFIRFPNTH